MTSLLNDTNIYITYKVNNINVYFMFFNCPDPLDALLSGTLTLSISINKIKIM